MAAELQFRFSRHQSPCIKDRAGLCCASPDRNEGNLAENNLAARFLNSCNKNGSRIAICDSSRNFTYKQIQNLALNFASHLLHENDFQVGDHVGLRLPNSAEYVVAFYGCILAGAIVVPLPMYEERDRINRLADLADVKYLYTNQPDPSSVYSSLRFSDDENSLCNESDRGGNQLAMLMFTSGTTGTSKAVMISHQNLISNAESIGKYLPICSDDRALAAMPFCHAFGNSVLQTHLLNGACLVTGQESAFVADIVRVIREFECTSFSAIPEIVESMLTVEFDADLQQQLRYLAVAGGAMDPARAIRLQQRIRPTELYVMYGQTEATARLAYIPPTKLRLASNSIGQAIPGVELEVRTDCGQRTGVEAPGILYAKGDNIMLGYWRDDVATQKIIQDGWLCTGDLAMVRPDGLIQLCGRSSELVKIQGYRFHPVEVEQRVMQAIPGVRATATDFEFYGKTRLALFVIPDSGNDSTEQKIRSVCRQILPSHMVPQRFKVLENWPLNSAGKVDRIALRNSLLDKKGFSSHRSSLGCPNEIVESKDE